MNKYEISKPLWNWILDIVKTEIPSQNIIAFHFGIFEIKKGYCFYLIGSNDYDESNEDWVCKNDFEPRTKYLNIQFHNANKPNWKNFLAITEELLSNFIKSAFFTSTFFYQAKAITTGFDDGNLITLYSNLISNTIFQFEQLTLFENDSVIPHSL
jgi:hypothetical protein